MAGIIVAIGYFVDTGWEYNGFITTLSALIAVSFSLSSYWYSDKIALSLSGAKEANYEQYPYLHNVVEGVAIAAGIPKPKVYVINDPSPNAFATGRNPNNSAIAVTTGLLELLNRTELEGVIAHEISHIKNYDILLATIAAILVGIVIIMRDLIFRFSLRGGFGGRSRRSKSDGNAIFLIIGLILLIIAPIFLTIIRMAISRQREYLADSSGAFLTRYPEGLASALEKLEKFKQPLKTATEAMAHMYIVNPFTKNVNIESLFNTHPPLKNRILRLRSIKGL